MPLAIIFILLLTLVLPPAAVASPPTPDGPLEGLPPYALFYDESVPVLTLTEVLAAPDLFAAKPFRSHLPHAAMHWLRLPLANAGAAPLHRILALGLPDMERLEAWKVGSAGIVPLATLGPDAAFNARPIPERILALPVELAAGEQAEIVLRYRTHADTPLQPALISPERFHRDVALETLADGAILGLLAALALLSSLTYRATRRPALLVYAAMALAMMAFMAQFQGYLFAYFWPDSGAWNQLAPVVLVVLVQAAHALFTMTVFDIRRVPGFYYAYLGYVVLLPVSLGAYLAAGWFWPGMASAMGYAVLSLVAGVAFLRRGMTGAAYYLAGTLAFAVFNNLLFVLGLFGVVTAVSPFVYPRVGYVAEALFLALALSHQTLALRRQVEEGLRLRLAEARQLAHAEAEKNRALMAAQRRTMQLAETGHDLSQPLSSIRFAVAALRRQDGNEMATRHIDQALDYTESLLRGLIDDAKRGHAEHRLSLKVDDLLESVLSRHSAAAAVKGLRLRHRQTGYRVEAAEGTLARILDNLVGNAVRYCRKGGVLLGARRRPDGIELQVIDTGPGFDPQLRDRLLAPFSQGGTLRQEREGHGLGLHIVRTLCESSGYRLTIRSIPGRGSVFGILIPASG